MPIRRTYADRAEYLKAAVIKRRKKVKRALVAYKGGKCILCGYSRSIEALDLHHLNEKTKSFGLSLDKITRSWHRVKQEADKCVLLCANCHREVHVGFAKLPTTTAYATT
ncbi:MAG: HNH endonuclease signature motif containing protein [Candidatus Andersenbacteria bacterium]